MKYKRILLKLSGEVLGNKETGECIDPKNLAFMAERVKKIHAMGCEVGIVLGGGNIFRGLTGASKGVNRVTGDSMGMLATIINGLAMMNALESIGVPTRVMTAIEMPKLAEPFIQRKAILATMQKERVDVILLDMNFSLGVNSGREGMIWLSAIHRKHPHVPVVLVTAYADVQLAVRGLKNVHLCRRRHTCGARHRDNRVRPQEGRLLLKG